MIDNCAVCGHLGILAQRGSEDFLARVDGFLTRWDVESGGDGRSFLIQAECPRFSTGEGKGILSHSIRGYDIFIYCDPFNYGVTYSLYGQEVPMTPDEHFQDLKRIIAATNGKTRRISVIMPMLYEGRQHRRFGRESLDCAVALQELTNMGVDNIITFDAHDNRVQNAIPLKGFESIQPTYQMIRTLISSVSDLSLSREDICVVSPDEGSMGRCIYYASVLGIDLGMFYKRRDYTVIKNGRNPIVSHEYLGESVEGKDVIVVDDMISTGDSVLKISEILKNRGAKRIFVFATFGLFTDGLQLFNDSFERGQIERVFTTNLIYHRPGLLDCPWYTEVDMAKYIAYIINTLHDDQSISQLLDPVQRIRKVLNEKKRNDSPTPVGSHRK
jgi:ribose-phosphate pyrophosphokinase